MIIISIKLNPALFNPIANPADKTINKEFHILVAPIILERFFSSVLYCMNAYSGTVKKPLKTAMRNNEDAIK